MLKEGIFKPLFKYPGGKGSEYKYLKKMFPKFNTYVEPFLGGEQYIGQLLLKIG